MFFYTLQVNVVTLITQYSLFLCRSQNVLSDADNHALLSIIIIYFSGDSSNSFREQQHGKYCSEAFVLTVTVSTRNSNIRTALFSVINSTTGNYWKLFILIWVKRSRKLLDISLWIFSLEETTKCFSCCKEGHSTRGY